MVESKATEACVDAMRSYRIGRDKLIDYRLIGIGSGIVEADEKGKMPVSIVDANDRDLNVLIYILVEPGRDIMYILPWKPPLGGPSHTSKRTRVMKCQYSAEA